MGNERAHGGVTSILPSADVAWLRYCLVTMLPSCEQANCLVGGNWFFGGRFVAGRFGGGPLTHRFGSSGEHPLDESPALARAT